MIRGIPDNVVLEQAAHVELLQVVVHVEKHKLVAHKVFSTPRQVVRRDIVARRRNEVHGVPIILYAARIVDLRLGHIVAASNADETMVVF